jgi:hypothetical protein
MSSSVNLDPSKTIPVLISGDISKRENQLQSSVIKYQLMELSEAGTVAVRNSIFDDICGLVSEF